jgi:hypothetical protein
MPSQHTHHLGIIDFISPVGDATLTQCVHAQAAGWFKIHLLMSSFGGIIWQIYLWSEILWKFLVKLTGQLFVDHL